MMIFESKCGLQIVVCGHILHFHNKSYDLRFKGAFDKLRKDFLPQTNLEEAKCDCGDENCSTTRLFIMIKLVEQALEQNPNEWGDNQKDYESMAEDETWQIRSLVALNGKYPKKFATDDFLSVRLATLQSLINDRSRGVLREDDSWVELLVEDPSARVRALVAEVGLEQHLDLLVSDKSATVRARVASFGSDKHRLLLASDKNSKVRLSVKLNGNKEARDKAGVYELSQAQPSGAVC